MTEDKEIQQVCVLVLDYGSPRSLEDVKTYYTRIRRGHAPSDEELQGLRLNGVYRMASRAVTRRVTKRTALCKGNGGTST